MDNANGVTTDLFCTRCGYNLRGLPEDGRCPECNAPVARSQWGNLLQFADADWLDTLRLGMRVKLWTIVVSLIGGVVLGVLTGALRLPPVLLAVFGIGASGLGLWAAFLITTQEPRVSIIEDPVSLRRVVRGCALAGLFAQVLQQAGEMAEDGFVLAAIGLTFGSVASVVSYFGEFVYLRRFARRIPDERLARSTTTVMWGWVISMAVAGVGAVMTGVLSGATGGGGVAAPAGMIVGGVVACSAGVAILVFAVWYIRLLLQYRDAFAAAALESRLGAVERTPGAETMPHPDRAL